MIEDIIQEELAFIYKKIYARFLTFAFLSCKFKLSVRTDGPHIACRSDVFFFNQYIFIRIYLTWEYYAYFLYRKKCKH